WWQANHPDWVEYQCDKTTVAYITDGSGAVPLDITNPAVLQYLEQTYYGPALAGTYYKYPGKYDGMAFDNATLTNGGGWSGMRCGHYDTSGNWIQQYSGTQDDPAWRSSVITW